MTRGKTGGRDMSSLFAPGPRGTGCTFGSARTSGCASCHIGFFLPPCIDYSLIFQPVSSVTRRSQPLEGAYGAVISPVSCSVSPLSDIQGHMPRWFAQPNFVSSPHIDAARHFKTQRISHQKRSSSPSWLRASYKLDTIPIVRQPFVPERRHQLGCEKCRSRRVCDDLCDERA